MIGFGLLMLLFGLMIFFGYPLFVLRPIIKLIRSDTSPNVRSKFSMTDLLALLFLIQLPIGLLNLTHDNIDDVPVVGFIGLMIISSIVWLAGLRASNHIGITSQLKRMIAIGIVFPMAVLSGFIIMAIFSVISGWTNWVAVAGSFLLLVLMTVFIYRTAAWIVKDSAMAREQQRSRIVK